MSYKITRFSISLAMLFRCITLLMKEPHTARELSDVTGMTQQTIARYLNHMHHEKLIHICDYGANDLGVKHHGIKVWKWGPGEDARFRKRDRRSRLRDKADKFQRTYVPAAEKHALGIKQV